MTAPATDYSIHDEGVIEAALDAAFDDWDAATPDQNPTAMSVDARVQWAGDFDRANNGRRQPNFDGLNLGALRVPLQKARNASARAGSARPSTSYTAKGWHAQLRALTGSARGLELADRAGLSPSVRTLQKWLSDAEYPVRRSDREKIAEAYSGMRTAGVEEARTRAEKANHELAEKLNSILSDRHEQDIRLFDITSLRFPRGNN